MRGRLRAESGWALLSAMVLMTVMLGGGLAAFKIVDTQTAESSVQRNRESAFNLAEAAMNAEVFALARDWPGKGMAGNQYPVCTSALVSTRCPNSNQLLGALPSADATGATWQTQVRDNGTAATQSFYRDDLVTSQPGYDANDDGKVWVRSTATARGKTRTLVALVRAERQTEDLPHASLLTGRLTISNDGNKAIIDATAGGGPVTVRCTPQLLDLTPCVGHLFGGGRFGDLTELLSFLQTQIAGAVPITGYTGPPAMTAEARARLKATAIADGTYYTGCPASLTGRVVYIEAGNCSYTGNNVFNSSAQPGFVIQNSGTMYIGGTVNFYGVIYQVNATALTSAVMQVQGNAQIFGGVLVDGQATTIAGSSKVNIVLDPAAFDAVASYGSAGVIQNTWREIKG
jgi:Tfp pilus assembly protein PilX